MSHVSHILTGIRVEATDVHVVKILNKCVSVRSAELRSHMLAHTTPRPMK